MAVLSKEDFFARLHTRIGEDTSDEAISFLEDMTDTFNDLEKRATGDGVNWEQRYHDLDESWKKRYRHRFFSGESNMPSDEGDTVGEEFTSETITVDDLFKEEKKGD